MMGLTTYAELLTESLNVTFNQNYPHISIEIISDNEEMVKQLMHLLLTRPIRTPAFWKYPHRPMITHTIDSFWIPSKKKKK